MKFSQFKISVFFCLGLVCSFNLQAHEYWLDVIDSSIRLNESVIVDVRNGQDFAGASFPYDASKFKSIVIRSPSGQMSYEGRLGDYPAIHPELTEVGLHSISVDTTAKLLVYQSWQQFSTFLTYHGLSNLVEQHRQRNLPDSEIKERYFRSAKTFVQANESGELSLDTDQSIDPSKQGAFTAIGSTFEMILLDNPYSSTKAIRAVLLYQGKPLVDRQTEMFWKGAKVLRFTARTDANGVATFEMLGDGDYLLNAVHVTEPQQDGVDWISHWASVTFER